MIQITWLMKVSTRWLHLSLEMSKNFHFWREGGNPYTQTYLASHKSDASCACAIKSVRGPHHIAADRTLLWARAPLRPACLYPWARCLISIASLTRVYLGPVVCGDCCNLSAYGACAWPAANHPTWSEMIVVISWRKRKGAIRIQLSLLSKALIQGYIFSKTSTRSTINRPFQILTFRWSPRCTNENPWQTRDSPILSL